ncbi:MAG: methyltransferase [Clostridia bacterium]|nr:methyltransferase [Clostridia bacterium]
MLTDKIKLFDGEHIEDLGEGIGVVVSKQHTFGTDAMLLAHFAKPKRNDIACDFGSGCGIIPFLWFRDGKCKEITAIEIQKNGCNQMLRSKELNDTDKITILNRDLKEIDDLKKGSFDLVTMNPPYKIENGGIKNDEEFATIARHETFCNMNDIAKSASRLLRFGGKLCICQRPERVFDVMFAMRENGIEPKTLRFVSKKGDTQPWLVLIEGKRGAKNGLKVEKNLVAYNDDGTLTDEMLEITEKYRK